MNGKQLMRARERLGLTRRELGILLGYADNQNKGAAVQVWHMENGSRTVRPAVVRLVTAYLGGTKPDDLEAVTGCRTWAQVARRQEKQRESA